jgi:hypothetical protein
MLTAIVTIYVDIDFMYKIGIGVLAFTLLFLATLANEILKQQKEAIKKAQS